MREVTVQVIDRETHIALRWETVPATYAQALANLWRADYPQHDVVSRPAAAPPPCVRKTHLT